MNKQLIITICFLLSIVPAGIVWTYWQDALNYQNSPHINSLWDKNPPFPYFDSQTSLSQSFKLTKEGPIKLAVRLEKGAGDYQWTIKNSLSPNPEQAVGTGHFSGDDIQNYDFLILSLTSSDLKAGETYWLEIIRTDDNQAQGIGIFKTANNYAEGELIIDNKVHTNDIVFQIYYSD